MTDLYPPFIHKGDLSPDSFGPDVDHICDEIHAACKGFGTDEKRLLKAMGGMTMEQRCMVPIRYKELHKKNLLDVIKSECGNRDFGTAAQFLAVDPVHAECLMLDKACKGLGTDELLLSTIICGRSNKEMELLKKKYFQINTKDLSRKLDGELGGALDQLIFNVLQAAEEVYDPQYHNDSKMAEDIEKLYKMGTGKWGTDEKGLFKILCASPPEYLKKLNLAYAEKHGYTLTKVLDKELGGHVRKAAMFMMGMKLKPYEEIANLIKTSCAGIGTNELLLTTILIRYTSILPQVMIAHIELFGKSIHERVASEVGGDYKKLLLQILEANGGA